MVLSRFARSTVVIGAICIALTGCSGGGSEPRPHAASAIITPGPNISVASGLTIQLSAEVLDQNGDTLTGQGLRWVSSDETRATVDQNGLVTGALVGNATITVLVGTRSLGSVTATVLPGIPTKVSITSPRIVMLDSGSTLTLTLTAKDAKGNSLSLISDLVYTSSNPTVATTNGRTVTGIRPGQALIIAQSVLDGTRRDSMLFVVTAPAGPVLMISDFTRFDLKTDTVFTAFVIMDMRTSTEKLGSTSVRISWDPALLTYESDAEAATGVGAVVNNTAAATGTLRMAVADVEGFTGRIELRRITFRVNAAAGRTGWLTLGLNEINGIGPTFTNLRPKSVGVAYPLYSR